MSNETETPADAVARLRRAVTDEENATRQCAIGLETRRACLIDLRAELAAAEKALAESRRTRGMEVAEKMIRQSDNWVMIENDSSDRLLKPYCGHVGVYVAELREMLASAIDAERADAARAALERAVGAVRALSCLHWRSDTDKNVTLASILSAEAPRE